jgi:hypothetical protein
MSRLIIDTSLFSPIEIEVNGRVYPVTRITRPVQVKMVELDRAWERGDIDVPFRRLVLLLGEHPEFDDLDISEVNKIIQDIIRKAYGQPGLAAAEEQKKVASPGETI